MYSLHLIGVFQSPIWSSETNSFVWWVHFDPEPPKNQWSLRTEVISCLRMKNLKRRLNIFLLVDISHFFKRKFKKTREMKCNNFTEFWKKKIVIWFDEFFFFFWPGPHSKEKNCQIVIHTGSSWSIIWSQWLWINWSKCWAGTTSSGTSSPDRLNTFTIDWLKLIDWISIWTCKKRISNVIN